MVVSAKAAKKKYAGVGVTYDTHVQNIGWQAPVRNGAVSGTSGRSLRLEGIHIALTGVQGLTGSIKYTTHVQNVGWQDAVADGAMAGTSGRALRLEGIKIWLTGEVAKHYDVLYRTHVQNVGWQGWSKNGSIAGTQGRALRLEAIQVKLSPKTEEAAGKGQSMVGVRYQSHVANDGWQQWTGDGSTSGTLGRSLRIEAFDLLVDPGDGKGGIQYQAHVKNIGWQPWVADGKMAGTVGRGLQVEAIRIKLTGDIAKKYDVYYRAHVQNVGWLDWARNGANAGSTNCGYQMEAMQVVLKKKGEAAPGPTAAPSYSDRWSLLEAQYLGNSGVNELLEVKYTGGSKADVVLRQKQGGAWKTVLTCQGYVGRLGIGKAREGDARTPEGNFGITQAFGIKSNPGSRLSYLQVNYNHYWCSDRSYYNQLVDITQKPHYCTGEHLIYCTPYYNYGLFLDFNTKPVKYNGGSAIFVHCYGSESYTEGCIAVSPWSMKKIIRTVGSGSRVLIYRK